jgi:hypothetical protein
MQPIAAPLRFGRILVRNRTHPAQMSIPPGEFAEFAFVARNPRDKAELVWTLRQRFADGTVRDWTKGPNGVRPTAMTKLTPRPAQ